MKIIRSSHTIEITEQERQQLIEEISTLPMEAMGDKEGLNSLWCTLKKLTEDNYGPR